MQIAVVIEQVANNGFRAKTGEPLALTAEGLTREEALRNLRALLTRRLDDGVELASFEVDAKPADNPWLAMKGMFKDDPLFEDWQRAIADYRREIDEDPDIP